MPLDHVLQRPRTIGGVIATIVEIREPMLHLSQRLGIKVCATCPRDGFLVGRLTSLCQNAKRQGWVEAVLYSGATTCDSLEVRQWEKSP